MPRPPLNLGLLLFEGCMPAGLFAAADLARAAHLRAGREVLRLRWVSLDGRPVKTWQGPVLAAEAALAEAGCEAWLLPGLWTDSPQALAQQLATLAPLVQALGQLPRRHALWSYCAGVALLAAAGRLDGRDATATWWLRPALGARFPKVHWRFDELLVSSGPVRTAAGPHGYLPLMLQALAERLEASALRDIEAVLMLPRPQQWPAAFRPVELMGQSDEALRRLIVFAQRQPAQALSLAAAAQALGLSVRSLSRWLPAQTGLAAGQWLRLLKLRQAAELLCESALPVKTVAEQLGYGSEAGLHRSFQALLACTPGEFRRRHARLPSPTGARP
ncbi:helix-turn-helix domain-containing protein [Pelomonas sp. BJYL3]|uniref:helix-turn-helix domain-containing protein n=1 Tax=Pelomonas sp. BJYL3 TaxID=2976697 RepID=UPI0022B2DB94|nr:helix-turn-helix domain-containing protein [Pelomonas sp. BJYL3]